MSRLVGSGAGLAVQVTSGHKTKDGERKECGLAEGRVLPSEGRVTVEARMQGSRELRGGAGSCGRANEEEKGRGRVTEEAACQIGAVLLSDRTASSSESFSAKEQ